MRARLTDTVLIMATVCCVCSVGLAAEPSGSFIADVAHYYMVTEDQVQQVLATDVSQNDIPVVFYFAQKSEVAPVAIAQMRVRGNDWSEIAQAHGLEPRDFYLIVMGGIRSKTYAPIFEKYDSTPIQNWRHIDLTDADIINLVNLRFVCSEHDYPASEIMKLRDSGSGFMAINEEVKQRKAERVQIDRDRRLKEARAAKSDNN